MISAFIAGGLFGVILVSIVSKIIGADGYFSITWIDDESYHIDMRIPHLDDQQIHKKHLIIMRREKSQ